MSKLLRKPYLFWSIIGALIYIPFLGASHLFDWDEINFAESAREMMVSGDYLSVQINFQPFWEKPPLFMWLQVLSFQFFHIYGVGMDVHGICSSLSQCIHWHRNFISRVSNRVEACI